MPEHEDMDVAPREGEGDEMPAGNAEKGPDFEPPQASVSKVLKRALGDSVQVGKEAKATFTRAAGIFILYVTACANDFCRDAKRTTISANDIYNALRELDFEEFIEPLRSFMLHHKETTSTKKSSKDSKGTPAKSGNETDTQDAPADDPTPDEEADNEDDGAGGSKAGTIDDSQGGDAPGEDEDAEDGGEKGAKEMDVDEAPVPDAEEQLEGMKEESDDGLKEDGNGKAEEENQATEDTAADDQPEEQQQDAAAASETEERQAAPEAAPEPQGPSGENASMEQIEEEPN